MILGVDVGASGCLVAMWDNGDYIDHLHMPVIKVGTKTRVNGAAVAQWLKQVSVDCSIHHAYIEQVNAMPSGASKMGTASAFSFGHSAGLVEGVIAGAGIPITLVTPQAWKKHHKLIGSEKDAARSRAVQLYPTIKDLSLKGKGQALGDAILIGRYGLGV